MKSVALVILIVPTLLLGCSSIVAPGQDLSQMRETGALKWAVTEYDSGGFHYVWIPHWVEGLLHLSSPHARNCKAMDVLTFRGNTLVDVEELGEDRVRWSNVLKAHGRIAPESCMGEASPLHIAITEKIVHLGSPTECVLFACGFPKYGPNANPRCIRPPEDIKRDDVLYYLVDQGGGAQEVVITGGKVSEIRPAAHLSKDWIPFYHPLVIP